MLAAAVAGGGLLPLAAAAAAQADETHRASHNGPQVTMISTGQIDDPFEDVLEHTSLLR